MHTYILYFFCSLSTKGVTKYGDAWARLAQRHQDAGVVVVDESDRDDDDEEDADDDFGGDVEPYGDEELRTSALPGGMTSGQRQRKKQDKRKQKGGGANKKPAPAQSRRGLQWDEDEHERFVQVGVYVRHRHWRREMRGAQECCCEHSGGLSGQREPWDDTQYAAAKDLP